MQLIVKRLHPEVPLPGHAHVSDAGADLHATEAVDLPPGGRAMVPTGIAVAIPVGWAGLVVPRSGLAARHGIGVTNGPGLIDAGYRGEVKVLLVNHGEEPVHLAAFERIAQLVVVPVAGLDVVEVDELPETARGAGGFGSTGR